MSLSYVAFPLEYTEMDRGYLEAAQSKLTDLFNVVFDGIGTTASGVDAFRMQGMGQLLDNRVPFTGIRILSNFLTATYELPDSVLQFFGSYVINESLRRFSGSRRTYSKTVTPHIGVLQGVQSIPEPVQQVLNRVLLDKIRAIQVPVFAQGETLDTLITINIRVPSINEPGFIELSKSWNEMDEDLANRFS